MNAVVTDEEQIELALEGPGARLRTARENLGLDISRVAAELHLGRDVLESIEADDYSGLPGAVFVQGYLRNYARLLNVPEGPVLEAFQSMKSEHERTPNLRATQVRHELRSSHAGVRLITWLIVIGLVVLVLTWWRGYLQWPMVDTAEDATTEAPAISAEPEFDVSQEPVLAPFAPQQEVPQEAPVGDTGLALPPIEEAPATEEPPQAVEPEEVVIEQPLVTTMAESATAAVEEATAEVTEATADAAPVVEAVVEEAPIATPPQLEAVVSFDADCWVEIRDASGQFKIFGLLNKGTSRVLEGEAPYKMVLGNAASVRISVNGEAYDFSSYIKGNVARFSFDPASAR
ncbi:MAG: RodZ family helix-turn-helix domain-containing protein [Sedimenticola sp.]